MRSRSCATGREHAGERAFTLIELLVVVLLIGLVAALVAVGAARAGAGSRRLEAMNSLIAELASARVNAMKASQPRSVRVVQKIDELRVERPEASARVFARPGLVVLDERRRPAANLEAKFGRDGRTVRRCWLFLPTDGSSTGPAPAPPERPASRVASAEVSAGTILWRIDFDPISGAPSLRRGDVRDAPVAADAELEGS